MSNSKFYPHLYVKTGDTSDSYVSLTANQWELICEAKNISTNCVVGHIMQVIELLNLPEKQEGVLKQTIKDSLWEASNDFCQALWDQLLSEEEQHKRVPVTGVKKEMMEAEFTGEQLIPIDPSQQE